MSEPTSNTNIPEPHLPSTRNPFPPTPPTHEPFIPQPVTHELLIRQTVSEKLLENRLRRMEMALADAEHKESLMRKRRMKQEQIVGALKGRAMAADKARELNIKETFCMKAERERAEEQKGQARLEQYEAHIQRIQKGRLMAHKRQNSYVLRIHNKEQDKSANAVLKKKKKQAAEQNKTDAVHFEEWNNYKQHIMQKHRGQPRGPPDRLYQQRQTTQKLLKQAALNRTVPALERLQAQTNQIRVTTDKPSTSTNSVRALMKMSRKAQFFGVHGEDMVQRTVAEMEKLRTLLEQHSLQPSSLQQQPEVVELFEKALLRMLH